MSLLRRDPSGIVSAVWAWGPTVAPSRRGRRRATDTRVTTRSRGVDDSTILCLPRAAPATSSGAGPDGVTGASRCPAGGHLPAPVRP